MSFAAHQDQDVKDQIRQATDIVELIGGSLQLRRQGSGYVALCPWHNDTRPSLQVNPKRQSWKCWVCDVGGDVFSFVMQREGVGFREALQMLADRAGIALRAAPVRAEAGSPKDKATLYRAMQWAEEQLHRCLLCDDAAEPARRYLHQRQISEDSIRRFHLGYSPDDWTWLLDRGRAAGFSPQVLQAAGLCGCSERSGRFYDRFRGRVIFSIRDVQGKPIACGGRVLPGSSAGEAAKYINSPETLLFSKSDQLYGLDIARDRVARDRQIVVVEGYTDTILAHQSGVGEVVAVLGTALGSRHIRLLKRFADRITLVLDGDEAGQRRTNEVLELFVAEQVDLRILTLPEQLDPCDFLLQRGEVAFRELLGGAVDALEHKIAVCTRGVDLVGDTHGANRALEEILGTMALAPHTAAAGGETNLREHQMLGRLARRFGVADSQLRTRLRELRRKPAARGVASSPAASAAAAPSPRVRDIHPRDLELLEILVIHHEYVARAVAEIDLGLLHSPPTREIFYTLHCLHDDGRTPDFGNVLTALDDPGLKNIWVEVDERAQAKAAEAQEDARQRLEGLIAGYRYALETKDRPHKLAALQERRLNEQEELDVLQKLIAQERNRQGISGPTEG